MAQDHNAYRESGLAAQVEGIRATIRRFDETTLAAARRIREAEKLHGEGTLADPEFDVSTATEN